jgi:hypothetical protein
MRAQTNTVPYTGTEKYVGLARSGCNPAYTRTHLHAPVKCEYRHETQGVAVLKPGRRAI